MPVPHGTTEGQALAAGYSQEQIDVYKQLAAAQLHGGGGGGYAQSHVAPGEAPRGSGSGSPLPAGVRALSPGAYLKPVAGVGTSGHPQPAPSSSNPRPEVPSPASGAMPGHWSEESEIGAEDLDPGDQVRACGLD